MKRTKVKKKGEIGVLHAIIEENRVICPRCGAKEEFASAYDYKGIEFNDKKMVQFFVRCIHKTGEDSQCNCCSTYLSDINEGIRYAVVADEELKEIIEEDEKIK